MKQSNFSEKSMMGVAVVLLLMIIAMFAWLWFGGERPSPDTYQTSEDLSPVSVAGLESKAGKLLQGLKNNSGIPIPEPSSKEGRADPFASL